MSGIGGIFQTDGQPVKEDLLCRIRDVIAHRGPDGSGIWRQRNIGLVHRLLRNTEESAGDQQPLTTGKGVWLVADCRIDNREWLKGQFRARGFCTDDLAVAPDSRYILLAYELWAEEAPRHLQGDFSFAVWDETRGQLFCARDPIGFKPFVYFWDGRRFAFGSEIKQILEDPQVSRELNPRHFADFLLMGFANREETVFQSVRRLPPAHAIRLRDGRFRLERYWRWDPDSEPLSRAPLDRHAEGFRHLFGQAVRARLRVPEGYRAGSLLSGGLDSSSIVSVAASHRNGSAMPTFTLLYPEANSLHRMKNADWVDESPYALEVVRAHGLEYHPVIVRDWSPLADLAGGDLWGLEGPIPAPLLPYFFGLFHRGASCRVRSLLHGEGGDEAFQTSGPHLPERLSFLSVLRFWLSWRRLVPEAVKLSCRLRVASRIPDWIDPAFSGRIRLRERFVKGLRWQSSLIRSRSRGTLCWLKWNGIPTYLETLERGTAFQGLEIRYPFLDLSVLRFMARIPWQEKCRADATKVLLREAMRGVLPELIRSRPGKSEYTPAIRGVMGRRALESVRSAVESPHPFLRQMVVPDKVRELYEACFSSDGSAAFWEATAMPVWHLWYLASVDRWLKRHA